TARGGIANSLFHRGNPVFRNRPAKNIVHKFDTLAAFRGLHLDAADAELTVAAGLLFVFAFGVGAPADRFAVSDFRRLQREVHVVTLVQLGHHHLYVLLAGTGE